MRSHRSLIFQCETDLKARCFACQCVHVENEYAYKNTCATASSEQTRIVRAVYNVASTVMSTRGHATQIGALSPSVRRTRAAPKYWADGNIDVDLNVCDSCMSAHSRVRGLPRVVSNIAPYCVAVRATAPIRRSPIVPGSRSPDEAMMIAAGAVAYLSAITFSGWPVQRCPGNSQQVYAFAATEKCGGMAPRRQLL
jgi:hypothetical protein